VLFYAEPARRERFHPADATNQVKELLALPTYKEMVMVSGRAFIVGRRAGNLHGANLPLIHKLLDGSVNGCDSKRGNLFASFLANLDWSKRSLGVREYCAQYKFLLGEIRHEVKIAPSELIVNYQLME